MRWLAAQRRRRNQMRALQPQETETRLRPVKASRFCCGPPPIAYGKCSAAILYGVLAARRKTYASAFAAYQAPYEAAETGRARGTQRMVHGVYRPRTNLCRCHANVRPTAYVLLWLDWRARVNVYELRCVAKRIEVLANSEPSSGFFRKE